MTSGRFVVVGQRTIKRILARCEIDRDVIAALAGFGSSKPAVVLRPIFVQELERFGTGLFALGFPDPKDRRDDLFSPRITFPCSG